MGQMEGEGIYESSEVRYTGNFKNGLFHGQGHIDYKASNISFDGCFQQGKKAGYGKVTKPNGEVFYGEFFEDLKDGLGTQKRPGEKAESGQWRRGNFQDFLCYNDIVVAEDPPRLLSQAQFHSLPKQIRKDFYQSRNHEYVTDSEN
jgi:hypothetical protein